MAVDGKAPTAGSPLMAGDTEAGEMRSAINDWGLALVRLDAWHNAGDGPLTAANGARLKPEVRDWMVLPSAKTAEQT